MDNLRATFPVVADASVLTQMNAQNPNGSWPDINYADHSQTLWQPGTHWTRLNLLCSAYAQSTSAYYGDPALRTDIINGINYWLSLSPEPSSTNWWFATIGLPKDIGTALISMRYSPNPLPVALENQCIAWMSKGQTITNQVGANLFDVGYDYIMHACLSQDSALMTQAVSAVSNGITIDTAITGEGLQADNSFRAHYEQVYIYGYGSAFLGSVTTIAKALKGTSFAISADKIGLVSSFVRKAYTKVSRGRYVDFSVIGRSMTRPNNGKSDPGGVSNFKSVDLAGYAAEYDQSIARMNGSQPASYQVTPEHLHFWRCDYSVHQRAGYMFSIRSASTRTVKSECVNNENLKGKYASDGANFIAVNGDEYYNIFPVWDWNKIPGTTLPEVANPGSNTLNTRVPGTSVFAGGVTDGQYGVSTYAMNDYSTKAKKAWFFFDKEVVCIGAGISSTATEAINTTVNQCLLRGPVNVNTGAGAVVLANGSTQYNNNLQWAHHDNVGYVFPQGGNVTLSNQTQTGDWYSINHSYSNAAISTDVFKLYLQHGTSPTTAKYAYIVVPGVALSEMASYDASAVKIWSNTDTMQAVYHSGLDMLQVVFYQAGCVSNNGITVKASAPCTVVFRNVSTANPTVFVSDPAQNLSSVNIGLQNAALGANSVNYGVNLPTGNMAGSSVQAQVGPFIPPPAQQSAASTVATGDAYVRDATYADTNFPTGNLVIKKDNTGTGYNRKAFIQFDLSAYTAYADKLDDTASLKLYVSYANTNITSTNWAFYEGTNNAWAENTITWNNQPAVQSAPFATIQGVATGNYVTIPIKTILNNHLKSADKKLTICVAGTAVGGLTDANFGSREATTAQQPLLIIFQPDVVKPTITVPANVTTTADLGTKYRQ